MILNNYKGNDVVQFDIQACAMLITILNTYLFCLMLIVRVHAIVMYDSQSGHK